MNSQDESHLRLLAIFHYVLAAGSALFSSIFLMHFFWGLATWRRMPFFGQQASRDDPSPEFGLVLMAIGGGAVLLGWSFAACLVAAGRSLARHRRYVFCLVMAALSCVLCNPFGTVLGVFTIVVLQRPSVKALFAAT